MKNNNTEAVKVKKKKADMTPAEYKDRCEQRTFKFVCTTYAISLIAGFLIVFFGGFIDQLLGSDGIIMGWGSLMIAMFPTFLVYISLKAPLDLKKIEKVLLFIFGLVLMVLNGFVYLRFLHMIVGIIPQEDIFVYEFFLIIGYVGYLLAYLLMNISLSPKKEKNSARKEADDFSFRGYFGKLWRGTCSVFRKIIEFKDKHNYLFISIIAFCFALFAIVFGLVILFVLCLIAVGFCAILVVKLIGLFGGAITKIAKAGGPLTSHSNYTVYQKGYTRTLTYKESVYRSYTGTPERYDRYVDDMGNSWLTDDNGKTFREDNDFRFNDSYMGKRL